MKKALFIDGRRSGYAPDQCGKTLTVGELIEVLQEYDLDREVFLRNDEGYTYGEIDNWGIIAGAYDDEDVEIDE